jgi:hypothetical protein
MAGVSRKQRQSCFDSRSGTVGFGGRDEQEQSEILRWLFWDNHKLRG